MNDASTRWSSAASISSIVSALIASVCCVGPLVLALLGLGGAGLLIRFEPYRPYFVALTACLLALGFYLTYRKPKTVAQASTAAGDTCACPAPRAGRAGRILLWAATVLVAALLAFPYLAPLIWR